ncbi:serine protease [Rhodospirillum rubrum]|uniref:DegQ family serine endoprotease n=1 Tax=Rhodospirillum rubrum TaxID=1085 RepID=UPI0019031991|nr:DegQ family serine endoprotease [Rhodospirillum rubrum]MBK1664105.1 serine protease [Rhodospirillum rubrum]MBK1675580.1 serine protease [Rhodospirillum rubrum]
MFQSVLDRTASNGAGSAGRLRRALAPALVPALVVVSLAIAPFSAQAREIPESFADLAEGLLPAVVNISTTQTIDADRGPEMPQFPPGSPFEEFFKDFFERHGGPGGGVQPKTPRRATSLGSGFIVDAAGYIVTNNHVIQDADEITVILHDDTAIKAELVGKDEKTDVALLRIKTDKPLTAVPWGNSETARVGDWVMAIGNPFGLGGTVTAGIISAKTRDINAGPYDSFIQTDAAINKGNSGGPLFNMHGEVIGINTAIFSPSGGSIGIGFSVPSNLAHQVIDDIKKFGRTRRGWIGVRIQSVTDEIAEGLGLEKSAGALIAAVTPGGPAAAAGLKVGDVIVSFDGRPVPDMRTLPRIVAETEIGKDAAIGVWREGKRQDLKMKVGELEVAEDEGLLNDPETSGITDPQGGTAVATIGLTVTKLDDRLRSQFGFDAASEGVVVTDVANESDAQEKGLEPGTLIVKINQTEVATAEDVVKAVAKAKDEGRKTVLLLVELRGTRTFIPVKLADKK